MGKSFQRQKAEYCYSGPAYIFLGVVRKRRSFPPVDFSYFGNDPRDVLDETIPRLTQGVFAGYVKNFVETVAETDEEVPTANKSTVPDDLRVTQEVTGGSGTILYSDDPLTANYYRANGVNAGSYWTWGGNPITKKTGIVVLRINKLKDYVQYYEAHFYERCRLKVSDIVSAEGVISGTKLDFRVLAAHGGGTCPLPAGQQSGAGWFFSIDNDGTNVLEHPMFLGETEWSAPDFGPYYGFF